ncbi:AraC family transcriptional regulator [Amycolatopsis bartoniae]|uniref:helix-turn-helix transcriptional regulator n=1 Tax=Amycolatopsis bartoniae TaxID=941986 RepID=UPI001643B73D|nr:AraC family transcriptional regulator [Amycolatopsis bartoniae]
MLDNALVPALPASYAVFRGADYEHSRAHTSRVLTPYKRVTEVQGLESDLDVAVVGPVSLVHGQHRGGEVHIQLTDPLSYYDVNLALAGTNFLECEGERLRLGRRTGAVISPRMRARMHLSERYRQMHVRIETAALQRNLERMLGRPVNRTVRFQVRMDLTAPAVVSWVRLVGLLVQDLHSPTGLSRGDGAESWADFLISGLLRAQPHNYSSALAGPDVSPAVPPRIKRVVDLIETQPASDLSLARLVEEAGVTARSLQRDFRQFLGTSPLRYVEQVRLAHAHRDLAARSGATVTEIAYRWGFGHVSRFAASYQRQYGVTPSQTLRGAAPGRGG